MPGWLAVGIGGFLGAVSRFRISLWFDAWSQQRFGRVYPFGTFMVNVLGCLLIGILMTLVAERKLPEPYQKLLITGCLGSLTTFSTFSFDAFRLMEEGKTGLAGIYVTANLVVGMIAVVLGIGIGRMIVR